MAETSDFFVVRRGSVAIPNAVVHDKTLSYAALALLTVCLALPDGAPTGYRALVGRGFGEHTTRKALLELEAHDLRFRFRTRRAGQLRTLTIISDMPMSPAEALTALMEMMTRGGAPVSEIVACESHEVEIPQNHADSYRAVDFAARSDRPVDNSSTVPWISTARSATAHSSKEESKNSSLRSEFPSIHAERAATTSPVQVQREASLVGGVDEKSSSVGGVAPAGPATDRALIEACVPTRMASWLMGAAAARVTSMLVGLVEAGWSTGAIYRRLNESALPPVVTNGPGLVIRRVEDLRALPVPGKKKLPAHSVELSQCGDSPNLARGRGREPRGIPPEAKRKMEQVIKQLKATDGRTR